MIKNSTTGKVYKNAAEAAHDLSVTQKDIRLHLNGSVRSIRGNRLVYISKKRIRIRRPHLQKPVRCIDTGRVYVSVRSAAKAHGISVDQLSRLLNGRRVSSTINNVRFEWYVMSKRVKIIETGEIFASAADCAAVLGCSVGMVVHCLKGRRKTAKGCTVEYTNVPARFDGFVKPPAATPVAIRDAAGRLFDSYADLARFKGVTPERARAIVLKHGYYKEPHHHDLFGPLV
ncbi:putative HNH endonuclease protein [Rhizobium phage RHph_Y52]|nr:putative HNH endonuclease protein [Rhizobium phage RHph_Y21]QIG76787.1 putative HNH endonuclease protein [Rhizobium phage RHph_Y52]